MTERVEQACEEALNKGQKPVALFLGKTEWRELLEENDLGDRADELDEVTYYNDDLGVRFPVNKTAKCSEFRLEVR